MQKSKIGRAERGSRGEGEKWKWRRGAEYLAGRQRVESEGVRGGGGGSNAEVDRREVRQEGGFNGGGEGGGVGLPEQRIREPLPRERRRRGRRRHRGGGAEGGGGKQSRARGQTLMGEGTWAFCRHGDQSGVRCESPAPRCSPCQRRPACLVL